MSESTNGADQGTAAPQTAAPDTVPDTAASEEPKLHQAELRVRGRGFLLAFYKTMRTITLYPIENAQVTESLDELTSATADILAVDGGLEMKLSSELFYVNDVRLRLELENFASFGQVLRICSHAGIGAVVSRSQPPAASI